MVGPLIDILFWCISPPRRQPNLNVAWVVSDNFSDDNCAGIPISLPSFDCGQASQWKHQNHRLLHIACLRRGCPYFADLEVNGSLKKETFASQLNGICAPQSGADPKYPPAFWPLRPRCQNWGRHFDQVRRLNGVEAVASLVVVLFSSGYPQEMMLWDVGGGEWRQSTGSLPSWSQSQSWRGRCQPKSLACFATPQMKLEILPWLC